MFFGCGVEPLLIFICISGASSFVVGCSCTVNPGMAIWFMFVATVLIAVTHIVPMFGAVVDALKPFIAVAILVDDFLIGTAAVM